MLQDTKWLASRRLPTERFVEPGFLFPFSFFLFTFYFLLFTFHFSPRTNPESAAALLYQSHCGEFHFSEKSRTGRIRCRSGMHKLHRLHITGLLFFSVPGIAEKPEFQNRSGAGYAIGSGEPLLLL